MHSSARRLSKAEFRREILARRDSLPDAVRQQNDQRIRERLFALPEFKDARTILLYASFRTEIDTSPLITSCLEMKKSVVLPRVEKTRNDLELYEIHSLNELSPGYFGIPEPYEREEMKRSINEVDLVITPGVAFDEGGNRLGYGKGFYDKLLKEKRGHAIALAYELQIVAHVPSESHDVKIDTIITEERIIHCHG